MDTNVLGFLKQADFSLDTHKTPEQNKAIELVNKLKDAYSESSTEENKEKLLEALEIAERLHPLRHPTGFMSFARGNLEDSKELFRRGNPIRGFVRLLKLPISAPLSLLAEPIRILGRAVNPKYTLTYQDLDEIKEEADKDKILKAVQEHIDDLNVERADPLRGLTDPSMNDLFTAGIGAGGLIRGNVFTALPAAVRLGQLASNSIANEIGINGDSRTDYVNKLTGQDNSKEQIVNKDAENVNLLENVHRV